MYARESSEFKQEERKLKEILAIVEDNLESIDIRRANIWNTCSDSQVAANLAMMLNKNQMAMEKAKKTPYFARIDFKEEGKETEEVYIGKCSVFDDDHVKVVDWRSPIASMYYDFELGEANYTCPEGVIGGDIMLKRQYNIQNSELVSFSDINSCSNDLLLQQCLSESSDVRLKNIVATIQSEQNAIIREKLQRKVIVQGVAGSGKTTVALHRIAYLVYAYMNYLRAEDILIIAPNRFFLDYISDTLPDMGVEDIVQKTYEDFVLELIDAKISVKSSSAVLHAMINADAENLGEVERYKKISGLKSSLAFKYIIDSYLKDVEKNLMEKMDEGFFVLDTEFVSAKRIKLAFLDNAGRLSIRERIDSIKKLLLDTIKGKIMQVTNNQDLDIPWEIFEEIKANGRKLVMNFMSNLKISALMAHYKNIISNKDFFAFLTSDEFKWMKNSFTSDFKNKEVAFEDLPALLYLQHKVFGIDKKNLPKYLVIDEAQDFGEFVFAIFNEILPKVPMSIFGDITQGIYSYRGVSDWQEVNSKIFEGECEILNLSKSYRTSIEVMDEANKVAEKLKDSLGIQLAQPVIRHGAPVGYFNAKNTVEKENFLVSRIQKLFESGFKNIALIGKNDMEVKCTCEFLKKHFEDVHLIDDSSSSYVYGINILPVNLSKGLEFDSVIVLNADEMVYSGKDILDAKLLYVAMTRAMHTLDIVYSNNLTAWLN